MKHSKIYWMKFLFVFGENSQFFCGIMIVNKGKAIFINFIGGKSEQSAETVF